MTPPHPDRSTDPYAVLEVARDASDAEVRAAYRRQVLRHHPDHNGGSVESARRFEAVQAAYAQVLAERKEAGRPGRSGRAASAPAFDPTIEARIAAMERELHKQRLAQAAARQAAAAEAAAAERADATRRPTPEELGYITTDDSVTKILEDAERDLAERWSRSRDEPLSKRLTDFFRDAG